MKIIIAEDEKRASRGLRNLLTMLSADAEVVAEATDGRQAFDLIKALKPDVVFTDIRMPFMDGISLIKAVRGYGMNVKFVIISAYEEFEYARQAISLGVVDYLVKPVTLDEAKEVWKRITEEKESESSGKGACGKLRDDYSEAHPLVQKALDMIECGYAARISQKDMAEKLGISAEYFSFLFSRDVKENFSRFLRRYRIEKAKQLLDTGEVPRDQIPYSVGFSDPKYFYKCFKEETGVNITEYNRTKR